MLEDSPLSHTLYLSLSRSLTHTLSHTHTHTHTRLIEDEWHVLMECTQYVNIRKEFEEITRDKTTLAAILEDTPPRILGAFISKTLRHREELLSKLT